MTIPERTPVCPEDKHDKIGCVSWVHPEANIVMRGVPPRTDKEPADGSYQPRSEPVLHTSCRDHDKAEHQTRDGIWQRLLGLCPAPSCLVHTTGKE